MKLFNTLTKKIEEFKSLEPMTIKMYACGPTVYDYAHIGNFRTFVFEDLMRRLFEFKDFKVKHVMNITDVDDKTISGAKKENKELGEFTQFYTKSFIKDLETLNILMPTILPMATEEIPEMISLIEDLVRKDIAYEKDGSVYYRIAAFSKYGKLSGKKIEKNIAGARVDVDEYEKEDGADFVLWKNAKEGEPSWNSPWGKGRPGWHIECSSMCMKYLGETIDIHVGGEDLIFPHHENEIAQSEASTGKQFVNYWIHCKFLLANGEKMAKSKGNFYTLRDLINQKYDPMAIRFILVSTHYRMPHNFTLQGLREAGDTIKKLDDCYFECLSHLEIAEEKDNLNNKFQAPKDTLNRMVENLENDFNVAACLASLLEGIKQINSFVAELGKTDLESCIEFFKKVDRLLGFDISKTKKIPEKIINLIKERHNLRKDPGFKKELTLQAASDKNRETIENEGWLVKDKKPGERSSVKQKRRVWD